MKKILPAVFFIFSFSLSAQWNTFQKKFYVPAKDCQIFSTIVTSDGGYLLTGSSYDGMYDFDMMIIKLNYMGDTMWTRLIGDTSSSEVATVATEYAGGYRIFGSTDGFGSGSNDMMVVDLDAFGDTLRTRVYGGPNDDFCLAGNSAETTPEGDLIFAGQTNSFGAGLYDMLLTRIDVNGNIAWSHTYGGTVSEQEATVCVTADGGFAGFGLTTSFGAGGVDFYLVKTDSLGNLLWSKTYGSVADEYGYGIRQTSDHGFLLTGAIQYSNGQEDALVIKTDSVGNIQWKRKFGGPNSEWGFSGIQTSDGGYAVTGRTLSFGNGGEDILFLRLDQNGDTLWTKAYGDWANDFAYSVAQTSDNGFVLSGYGPTSSIHDEMYFIKTDANGNSGCHQAFAPVTVTTNSIVLTGNPNTLVGTGCTMKYSAPPVHRGCTVNTLCFAVGMDENIPPDEFEIFPDPSNGIFTIRANNRQENTITVFNLEGQKIMELKNNLQEQQVGLENSVPGIYFVRIMNEEGVFTKKVIVQ
jgi:hypothetical protein